MGCFSWMFCDKQNKKPLNIGDPGNILCPDGTLIHTDSYDGYGCFGPKDDVDVYDLVADWNRQYLIEHPDFEIPQHGRRWDEKLRDWVYDPPKTVSDFEWWVPYSDPRMSHKDIETYMKETKGTKYWEYRWIGIAIACYENQNEALPFPIKIVSDSFVKRAAIDGNATEEDYKRLIPSIGDPNQGFGPNYY